MEEVDAEEAGTGVEGQDREQICASPWEPLVYSGGGAAVKDEVENEGKFVISDTSIMDEGEVKERKEGLVGAGYVRVGNLSCWPFRRNSQGLHWGYGYFRRIVGPDIENYDCRN